MEEEAQGVSQRSDGAAQARPESGIARRHKKKSELGDDDIAHMRKVNGYVHRHLAQRLRGDTADSQWRYSLMNWGHDPEK